MQENKIQEIIKKSNEVITNLVEEIFNEVKKDAETYNDIQKNISMIRKNALWENNMALLDVADKVTKKVEDEKNGLPIK